MEIILGIIIVLYLIHVATKKPKYEDAKKWKPTFQEGWTDPPPYVLDQAQKEWEQREKERELEKTHFYDTWYKCWVIEQPDGTFIKEKTGEPFVPAMEKLIPFYEYYDYKRNLEAGYYDENFYDDDEEKEETEEDDW